MRGVSSQRTDRSTRSDEKRVLTQSLVAADNTRAFARVLPLNSYAVRPTNAARICQMLKIGQLDGAFTVYWDEMDRCRKGRSYWSLLHVTVCLPDICAALQSAKGETTGALYRSWCDQYLTNPKLTGAERWEMRCKVSHQGRASIPPGRYDGFSFAQPAPTGQVDHMRLEGKTLVVDVGKMAEEMKDAVQQWIQQLESNPSGPEAVNTEQNLPSLIQVRQSKHPAVQTIIINRSS